MKKILALLAIIGTFYLEAIESHSLIVTGVGRVSVKASVAEVKIGIEVEGKTSGEVQQGLSNNLKSVVGQLKGQVDKLQTGVVNVYSILSPTNPSTVSGYRSRIDISFSTQTERAPDLIDKAFKAGANQLIALTFKPDEKTIAVARLNALQAACANAILEARTVMEALGISSSKIDYVKIEPLTLTSQFKAGDPLNPNAQISTSATAEIIQQEQDIPAFVTLRFDLNEEK